MKSKKKGNKVILFFIYIILIVWSYSIFSLIKPILFYKISFYKNNTKKYENLIDTTLFVKSNNVIIKETNNRVQELIKNPRYKIYRKNINIPVLIYHNFSQEIPKNDIYKLTVSSQRFEENIVTLLNNGYTFITFEDLYDYYYGKIGLPEKVILITADDGWLGNYTEMFPILKKYNIPATIFVVEELIGTPSYFTWDNAKEMYNSGLVKIHTHGKRHINYSSVSKNILVSEIDSAHKKLEYILDDKLLKVFAYPSGKNSNNSKKWLLNEGFEIQVLTNYGTVNTSNTLDLQSIRKNKM